MDKAASLEAERLRRKVTGLPLIENPPELCQVCRSINLDALLDSSKSESLIDHAKSFQRGSPYMCRLVYDDPEQSSLSCPMCKLILLPQAIRSGEPTVIGLKLDEYRREVQIHGARGKNYSGNIIRLDYATIFALPGTYASGYLPIDARLPWIQRSFGLDETFAKIRPWIVECNDSHPECHSEVAKGGSEPPRMPTRVIDIGKFDSLDPPRLLVTEGLGGNYLALSHCWGGHTNLMTEKKSLEAHKQRLDVERMSKTFRDALLVTQQLGLRYLWIDSLCIIQDDAEDWAREALTMGRVYQQAYCTIAATAAQNGDAGCFVYQAKEHHIVGIPCRPNDPASGYMYFRHGGYHRGGQHEQLPKDKINAGPLVKRGWVLQERVLSTRTIQFAYDQVYWECSHGVLGEDRPTIQPGPSTSTRWGNLCRNFSRLKKGHENLTDIIADPEQDEKINWLEKFHNSWNDLVEQYSRCSLTFGKDKLPAISGIANLIQEQTGLEYHHGHWIDNSLPSIFSLLWHRAQYDTPIKPDEMRSPSWSWAAMEGVVMFGERYAFEHCSPYQSQSYTQDVRLLRVDTSERFGIKSFSTLILSGRRKPASRSIDQPAMPAGMTRKPREERAQKPYHPPSSSKHPNLQYKMLDRESAEHVGFAYFDDDDIEPLHFDCVAWFTCHRPGSGGAASILRGLLVTRSPDDGGTYRGYDEYRRIGIAHILPERSHSWLLEGVPETIFALS